MPTTTTAAVAAGLTNASVALEPVATAPAARVVTQPGAGLSPLRAGEERAVRTEAKPALPPGPDPALLARAEDVLRQIKLHLAPGVRRITLDLEPADLGRIAVQLALRAGKVTAIVRGENPETLALLEQREGDLRQVFARHGVQPDSVRFELGFGGRSRGGRAAERRAPAVDAPATSSERAPALSSNHTARPGGGLVDTLA